MLAVFAKWLGVVQPLRDALANVEHEAWDKDGRSRFRRALGVGERVEARKFRPAGDRREVATASALG